MTGKQRYVFLVAMVTGFVSPFMSSALNLSIASISSDFSAGATSVTWVISTYTLGTAIFSIPLGHLADVKGRRRVLIAGAIGFSVFSFACIVAPNVYFLIGSRVAMSIASDAFLASNVSLILLAFPPERTGRMLGLYVTAVAVGLTAGPVVGGMLSSALSWRFIFVIGVIAGLFVLIVAIFRVDADTPHESGRFDKVGSVLFMVSLAVAMFGLSEWTTLAWAPACFAVGAVLVGVFIFYESRIDDPIMQVRLFVENTMYGRANFAALLNFAAFFSVSYTMAIYLEVVQGLDAGMAGLVMLSQPVMQAIVSPIAGNLSDRMRPTTVASFGVAVIAVGLFMLSGVDQGMPLWRVIVCLALIGFGNSCFTAPNNSVVVSCVPESRYSEANATITAMRGIGQSLSIVIVSLVLGATVGNTVLAQVGPDDLAHAIHVIMTVCGFVSVAAVLCSLHWPKRKRNAAR